MCLKNVQSDLSRTSFPTSRWKQNDVKTAQKVRTYRLAFFCLFFFILKMLLRMHNNLSCLSTLVNITSWKPCSMKTTFHTSVITPEYINKPLDWKSWRKLHGNIYFPSLTAI